MTYIDAKYQDYLDYLYNTANIRFPDCPDIDGIVQDTLLAFFVCESKGEHIEYPKSYLNSILIHKYNDHLRGKYKNSVISFENIDMEDIPDEDISEEYEAVRREIGRLVRIYREVTVLHYVHGKSVDEIANELDIPRGTVLSRLSTARKQVKEGIDKMEKYSDISYEPKSLSLGIWGNPGLGAEPFSLVTSPIEENILVLAYNNPVSIKGIADTMGMPCAYIEPLVDRLIHGELMGRTTGGLVYTRCFIQSYRDSLGDIDRQGEIAQKLTKTIWEAVKKQILPLCNEGSLAEQNDKQKATFVLFMLKQLLTQIIRSATASGYRPAALPERPNGGAWLVSATVFEPGEKLIPDYYTSGPACCEYHQGDRYIGKMYDYQSFLGDTQNAYRGFKYNFSPNEIFAFLCSFAYASVRPDNARIYELCPDFEKAHILKATDSGYCLDIPYMSTKEFDIAVDKLKLAAEELNEVAVPLLSTVWSKHINNVPNYVDEHSHYRHTGGLGVYIPLQLKAVIDSGVMPYPVRTGKTPIMLLALGEV